MTVRITDTANGTPVEAACDQCGTTWRRPPHDPHADTLPEWARSHPCRP